jgi:hypothetical protein
VAITRPPIKTKLLFSHDLQHKKNRIANVVHLIRLCGVISWMAQQLEARKYPEFRPFLRYAAVYLLLTFLNSYSPDGLTEITLGKRVKKQFKHTDAAARVSHLEGIYKLLKERKVPNTDALHSSSQEPEQFYVMTEPVGMHCTPDTGFRAFRAVICVLEALKVYLVVSVLATSYDYV